MGQCQTILLSHVAGNGVWAVASVQWSFYVSPDSRRAAVLSLWLSLSIAPGKKQVYGFARKPRKTENNCTTFLTDLGQMSG